MFVVVFLSLCLLSLDSFPCNYYKQFTWGDVSEGCRNCNCDVSGAHSPHCNGTSGECYCRRGNEGRRCERCSLGFWRRPSQPCTECNCSVEGSMSGICDAVTGQCDCAVGHSGLKCDECDTGYVQTTPNNCSECGECSGRILQTLKRSSAVLGSISTVSQDFFVTRTTAKLKRLQKKSDRIMVELQEKVGMLGELSGAVSTTHQAIFNSPSSSPLPRQADKLLIACIKSYRRLEGVARGLDESVALKDQYFLEAYHQYEYTKYRLPLKLAQLTVTRNQLRIINKQVRALKNTDLEARYSETRTAMSSQTALLFSAKEARAQSRDVKEQISMKEGQVEGLLRRAVFHRTTQAEMWYGGAIDANLLLASNTRLSQVQTLIIDFHGWVAETGERITRVESSIPDFESTVFLLKGSRRGILDLENLRSKVLEVPGTITIPQILDPYPCRNTGSLLRTLHGIFTDILTPGPLRDISRIRDVISHIDTVTSLPDLGDKYSDTELLGRGVRRAASRLHKHKIAKLQSTFQVSNHRLKSVGLDIQTYRQRLTDVQTRIQYISRERDSTTDRENYEFIKEQLENMTDRKKRFRNMERSLRISMDRVREKIEEIKLKVLTFESVKFYRSDWVAHDLAQNVREISISFRGNKKAGTILSIGRKGKEWDLVVSVVNSGLTVSCHKPTTLTVPLNTDCGDGSFNHNCYDKLGSMAFQGQEWFDPESFFDIDRFADLTLYITYGEVRLEGRQDGEKFLSLTAPCTMTPRSIVLTKPTPKQSGIKIPGFAGCLSNFKVDGKARGIRHATEVSGTLTQCSERSMSGKSVRPQCEPGYLPLSSTTLLPAPSAPRARPATLLPAHSPLRLRLVISSLSARVHVLSAGQLRLSARRGHLKGSCKGISVLLREVYGPGAQLDLEMEMHDNYVTFRVERGGAVRSRKLPCVIKEWRGEVLLGSDNEQAEGCIKTLP